MDKDVVFVPAKEKLIQQSSNTVEHLELPPVKLLALFFRAISTWFENPCFALTDGKRDEDGPVQDCARP
jgi:hypothetical protein